jgi:hypothetical protein
MSSSTPEKPGSVESSPPDLASSLVGVKLNREEMAELRTGAVKWVVGLLLAQAVVAGVLALLL